MQTLTDVLVEDLRATVVGAAAGTVATAAMSVLMIAGREAGLMSELPPHVITSKAVDRAGAQEAGREERRQLGWLAHFAFGAVAGAIYGLLRRWLRTPGPPALHGAIYALGIWAASYMGWVPALRFLPPAHEDEPGRQPVMMAAHVIFGAVLGALVERALGRRR